MESGRNAEQRKKQKMKQRFFYAYLEDPRETKSKYDSSIASQLSEPGPLCLLQNVLLLHKPILTFLSLIFLFLVCHDRFLYEQFVPEIPGPDYDKGIPASLVDVQLNN